MTFIKVLAALQLSMLLVSLTSVSTLPLPPVPPPVVKPPVPPPVVKPPPVMLPPVMAPAYPPVAVPIPSPTIPKLPIKLPVAVQGVVFCKTCKYPGEDTLQGAKPLAGAIVKMICTRGTPKAPKSPIVRTATTDKKGYFFVPPTEKVSSYGAVKRCKVFLYSPPKGAKCTIPTNLHYGKSGAILKLAKPATPVKFALYTVGPFAYKPVCPK